MTTNSNIGKKKRVLLLCNGGSDQTTGKLFMAMEAKFQKVHCTTLRLRSFKRGVFAKLPELVKTEWRNMRDISKHDVLIVHSSLSLSIFSMLLARLFNKTVIAFIWDFYPASAKYVGNIKSPILLCCYAFFENLAYRLAHRIYVPTEDYANFSAIANFKNVQILPLWPDGSAPSPIAKDKGEKLDLAFAGQVNAVRGISDTLSRISNLTVREINFHLFSKDHVPHELNKQSESNKKINIQYHGFLSSQELLNHLQMMNYGIVSLAHNFNLPAFPSKILTYLSAGIPVIYDGPAMPALEKMLINNGLGVSVAGTTYECQILDINIQNFTEKRDLYFLNIEKKWNDFVNHL